ncbi:MAG TPA: hypothetical protein VMB47_18245 [Candidatus Aquilonibacter sp.]|nr:hypothetical protein [Candidatus Aquilonibacter sp.]
MRLSPILGFHICMGVLGFLSGAAAMSFRKGSCRHALAGTAFVFAMLCLAASGVYLAAIKSQPGNILGGALTFYLVATAWVTAKHRKMRLGIFDRGALAAASAVGVAALVYGITALRSPTGMSHEYSSGPYFFLALVALISFAGDVRMFARGGVSGTQRIARHLWRMSFAFFIASASIFLARRRLFPSILRRSGLLVFLSVLPLILMVFWLWQIRITKPYEKKPLLPESSLHP